MISHLINQMPSPTNHFNITKNDAWKHVWKIRTQVLHTCYSAWKNLYYASVLKHRSWMVGPYFRLKAALKTCHCIEWKSLYLKNKAVCIMWKPWNKFLQKFGNSRKQPKVLPSNLQRLAHQWVYPLEYKSKAWTQVSNSIIPWMVPSHICSKDFYSDIYYGAHGSGVR